MDDRRAHAPDASTRAPPTGGRSQAYAALDLGTNNCRLLVARPSRRGFRVVDAFSRIIRLGEGVSTTGRLTDDAINRTLDALNVCAQKLGRHEGVIKRLVATEACRIAENAPKFLERVRTEIGLEIEILSRQEEARLAVSGCSTLIDPNAEYAMVFDIGGGSSEIIWLDLMKVRTPGQRRPLTQRADLDNAIVAWTSLPVGVVTLAERFGTGEEAGRAFNKMVGYVAQFVRSFEDMWRIVDKISGRKVHMLGTSGTVTTLAGIHLGLTRYDRSRVDGCWIDARTVRRITADLAKQTHAQRKAQPCIGADRADLVLAGCAILEALLDLWPCERVRVADRGLREGILATLMAQDGHYRQNRVPPPSSSVTHNL
jgi:exopolyphosphatase / guanosine-5'-triphosphate,3'-diphosphate pyrophosphatase